MANLWSIGFAILAEIGPAKAWWERHKHLIPRLQEAGREGREIVERVMPEMKQARLERNLAELQALGWVQSSNPVGKVHNEKFPELDIKWLQESLTKLGWKVPVDGEYGELTKAAVRNFQAKYMGKDQVDGWAGVLTTAAIVAELKKLAGP
jgi:hypothetical protein